MVITALQERPEGTPDAIAWKPWVEGRIINHHVDANHHGLMDPRPVAEIARAVLDYLDSDRRR
jgi:thioesterase domain-containing protein